jgi:signal transduction histidine kinase
LVQLAEQINQLIEQKKASDIGYRNKELQQRREITNISHDLRTPLTSVIGYLQLCLDQSLPAEQRKRYLDIVIVRAKHLQELITDFFELSRYEAGEEHLELQEVRLQDLLCELFAAYYGDFTEKGITPSILIDEKTPAVIGDERAFRRIYQNLLQNVLKHGSDGVEISLAYHKEQVVTSFANRAPDLTQGDLEHLFERTYMADQSRSKKNTGLGLSIVKTVTEQMRGSISASLAEQKLSITIGWKNTIK